MKLFVLTLINGEAYEDYEEYTIGVFGTYAAAQERGLYILRNQTEVCKQMWENDWYGFGTDRAWDFRIDEFTLNQPLY